MRCNLPPADSFIGKILLKNRDHLITHHIASGNNGHLFRAFDSSTESTLAIKFVPSKNLRHGDITREGYLDEAKKANRLDHPSAIKCHEVSPYEDPELQITGVIFVYDYVDGKDLRKYMKAERDNVDVRFVERFLETMFELLFELKQRNLQHGDLHAGNVLVATSPYDIHARPTFRVTDFGVGELTGHTSHANDYLHVADILKQLMDTIDYHECEARDRYVFEVLRKDFLARHLIETDTTADPLATNPHKLLDKLNSLDDQYMDEKGQSIPTLQSPFDYPNCEQIGNSHLLLRNLYSNRLLGLPEIRQRSNLILTGPRGCGKTTVFRALSLDYLSSTGADLPNDLNYIGIYYRCDDLYFAFPRYKIPVRNEALDLPMHFLIVTLIGTALEQILSWSKKYFAEEIRKKEEIIAMEFWDLFGWSPPDSPVARHLSTLVNRLKGKERKRATKKQRFAHVPAEPIDGYFGPGKLFEACELIRNRLSFLQDRHLYFFIDDYSHPKITKDLQANLNRLVMHRSPDVFFKLSTESPVSFARDDVDGKQYVESREYDLLNIGLRYIDSNHIQTLEFLEDLFERRFREVENYPVKTLAELVGSMPRNENATARAFREHRGRDSYAAAETIAAMCSGDIHYIIRLVSRMVEDFGGLDALVQPESKPRIPPREQHRSIRAAAGSFMESVRTLPKYGQKLADIVAAFGNVARSYLQHKSSSNKKGNPPHQASRIEPYEPLRISDEANCILEELLRYSILIEDPRGKSRRGKLVPRFYLRRYLVPHFGLTFSRRDSLQLENADIETLLLHPQKFENKWRLKSKKDASRLRRMRPGQGELFSDE